MNQISGASFLAYSAIKNPNPATNAPKNSVSNPQITQLYIENRDLNTPSINNVIPVTTEDIINIVLFLLFNLKIKAKIKRLPIKNGITGIRPKKTKDTKVIIPFKIGFSYSISKLSS